MGLLLEGPDYRVAPRWAEFKVEPFRGRTRQATRAPREP